MLLTFHKR